MTGPEIKSTWRLNCASNLESRNQRVAKTRRLTIHSERPQGEIDYGSHAALFSAHILRFTIRL